MQHFIIELKPIVIPMWNQSKELVFANILDYWYRDSLTMNSRALTILSFKLHLNNGKTIFSFLNNFPYIAEKKTILL